MARQKFEQIITGVGSAVWPKLIEPDTKFKEHGEYTCRLALDAGTAAELTCVLEQILDQSIEDFKNDPENKRKLKRFFDDDGNPKNVANLYTEELNADDEETGRLLFNFKKPAAYKDKASQAMKPMRKPTLFDSQGKEIVGLDQLWGGSRVAIAGHVRPYAMESTKTFGLSLRLDAVQVIELSNGGNRDAESFGFTKTDGGYVATSSPFSETSDGADVEELCDDF